MTCIVGLIDKENGITYIGGDSCASTWASKITLEQRKVFKLKDTDNALMGFSGTVRDLDLIRYATGLIDTRDEPNIDHEYVVTNVIPKLSNLMDVGNRNYSNSGQKEIDSLLLLAYKDKLWKIESNYAVVSSSDNFSAIGSGFQYALGSLESTKGLDISPAKRIQMALGVASKFGIGVAPPFYIMNTKNDEVIEIKGDK